jgi:hypothetical protein
MEATMEGSSPNETDKRKHRGSFPRRYVTHNRRKRKQGGNGTRVSLAKRRPTCHRQEKPQSSTRDRIAEGKQVTWPGGGGCEVQRFIIVYKCSV